MPRRRGRLLGNNTFAFMGHTTRLAAELSTEAVIKDLKLLGPYFSGTFERSWVAVPGRKGDIPPTVPQARAGYSRVGGAPKTITPYIPPPLPKVNTRVHIMQLLGRGSSYTIGNKTTYRAIAMDLIPGRTEKTGVASSAAKNWFRTYLNGGAMDITVKEAIRAAALQAKRNPETTL